MIGHLRHDLFDRLAPAIAGECVGIAGIDDQRTRLAQRHLFASEFHLARTAHVPGKDARNARTLDQFDIGQVAAVPILVASARDARRCTRNLRHVGEGQG